MLCRERESRYRDQVNLSHPANQRPKTELLYEARYGVAHNGCRRAYRRLRGYYP
jgi:hypothetical protein